jgi:hypothetical protein
VASSRDEMAFAVGVADVGASGTGGVWLPNVGDHTERPDRCGRAGSARGVGSRLCDAIRRLRVTYDLTALGPHAAERLETSRVNFTNYIGEWEAAIAAMSPAGA